MVVVVLIAAGAAICLKLYKTAERAGHGFIDSVLFSIRQQAGVMAALSATVFAVLTALTTGKTVIVPGGSSNLPSFGSRTPATGGVITA